MRFLNTRPRITNSTPIPFPPRFLPLRTEVETQSLRLTFARVKQLFRRGEYLRISWPLFRGSNLHREQENGSEN